MPFSIATWRWIGLLLSAAVALASPHASAATACTLTQTLTPTIGTYSPGAVKAAAAPALQTRAGLSCPTSAITLLSSNKLKAKVHSANSFKLVRQGGTEAVGYVASADAAGTTPFVQDVALDFMQNNLLNALGLLGGSAVDVPLYLKTSTTAALPPVGTYVDTLTVDWEWFQCTAAVNAAGLCLLGTLDSGTGTTTITVKLIVSPVAATITLSSATTWDPVSGTSYPKALPASRRRATISVANPDIVPLDANKLKLVVPTPAGMIVALDGDGTGAGAAIRMTDGSPTSTLAFTYTAPDNILDDVDFSSDGGNNWDYYPISGDTVSEARITHVRLRPRGAMAKQSNFSMSLPYLVRP
jgi:hypothetical protein